jgi:RNA-directed DNA polymerase
VGVDRVSYAEYAGEVRGNLEKLHDRLKQGQYRAQPLRRIYIPKEDGRQRPISIPSLEDKIVQKATVSLLNAIYEQDFLDCSYGFRPGRGPHDALDEVGRIICRQPISTPHSGSGYFRIPEESWKSPELARVSAASSPASVATATSVASVETASAGEFALRNRVH